MALVVMLYAPVWRGEQQAVVYLSVITQLHAAAHRRVERLRLRTQPGHSRAIHRLGVVDRLVGKAARKCYRQQDQIAARERRHQTGVIVTIARRVMPARCALDERYFQSL